MAYAAFLFLSAAQAVTGANPQPVLHAIQKRHCSAITEFDAKEYDAPAADAPVIKEIVVQTGATIEGIAEGVGGGPTAEPELPTVELLEAIRWDA